MFSHSPQEEGANGPAEQDQAVGSDNREIVRAGLKTLLADTEIKVVAEVATGWAAVDYAREHDVDVVLMGMHISDGDGLATLGRIELDKPGLPILMYSSFDNPAYIARAVALGASGYLLKGCTREEPVNRIRAADAGENAWTCDDLRRITGALAMAHLTPDVEVSLSKRESEVLQHLTNGQTNKQIAQTLGISYETAKEHAQHVLRKIGVNDRTQAAVWAVRKGLV